MILVQILLETELFLTVSRYPWHTTFHRHSFIGLLWLNESSKNGKSASHPKNEAYAVILSIITCISAFINFKDQISRLQNKHLQNFKNMFLLGSIRALHKREYLVIIRDNFCWFCIKHTLWSLIWTVFWDSLDEVHDIWFQWKLRNIIIKYIV